MKTLRKKFGNQAGQSLVEFALVLPVFIIVIFGIIEFGRIWMTMNVITSAAREGVRIAAVTPPDVARVQNTVQNLLNASNINGAIITVAGPNAAREVTVTVQCTYTPITGAIIPGFNVFQIVRSSVMHWEG
ncbi:pilus assembly protein [candidate division KSB1 bacterium]|nr:pilus assembly protein [candidate division KSB1 bacterium]